MRILTNKTYNALIEQIESLRADRDKLELTVRKLKSEIKKLTPVRDCKGKFIKR